MRPEGLNEKIEYVYNQSLKGREQKNMEEMIVEKLPELVKNMTPQIQEKKCISNRISKRKPMQFPYKET